MSASLTSPSPIIFMCPYLCLNKMFLMVGAIFFFTLWPSWHLLSVWILENTSPPHTPNLLNTQINAWVSESYAWEYMIMRISHYHNHVSHISGPRMWMTVLKTPIFIMSLFTSYCYRNLAFYTRFFLPKDVEELFFPIKERQCVSLMCVL